MNTRKNQAGGLFGIFNSKEKQLRDALLKSQQPDFVKAAAIVNNGAKVNAVLYENVTPLYLFPLSSSYVEAYCIHTSFLSHIE
jgi:hypothetical protein